MKPFSTKDEGHVERTGWMDEILTGTIHLPRKRQGLLGMLKSGVQMWQAFHCKEAGMKLIPSRNSVLFQQGKCREAWVEAVLSAGEKRKKDVQGGHGK